MMPRPVNGSPPFAAGLASVLRGVKKHWARWLAWRRQRAALMSLSDAELKDIGISRAQASFEFSSPYWREPTIAGSGAIEGVNRWLG
ncbi:MAG: DUF1127 domain-containing protein, partial [Acetobacteraceae bacterium]